MESVHVGRLKRCIHSSHEITVKQQKGHAELLSDHAAWHSDYSQAQEWVEGAQGKIIQNRLSPHELC